MITRINKLEETKTKLKDEFIGLDSIIDQLITSITPWYVTPEIIQRPLVISLWGMTGTGKTSVIRRTIQLLELDKKTMFFDCGKETGDKSSIVDKISDFFKLEEVQSTGEDFLEDLVFVFDEFQYARTISEDGSEIDKPGIRPVWNLMDHGTLNLNEENYEASYVINFIEDFLGYAKDHSTVKVEGGKIKNPEDIKVLLEHLGFFHYDRGIPGIEDTKKRHWEDGPGSDETEDPYREIDIIEKGVLRSMLERLKIFDPRPNIEYLREIQSFKTVGEVAEFLKRSKTNFLTPRYINCSKALIFVLGNLDEAFVSSVNLSPDIDADIFYDETSKVTNPDIKNALLRRFRPEQIARIGNNIIKYPSLKKDDFRKVIKKEVGFCCEKFKESTGITVNPTPNFLELIYSEGVFPTQGVRPLFATIGTIFTPIFSDILINGLSREIIVDVKDPESGYNLDQKTIIYGGLEKEIKLNLGALRNPGNRKLKYATSVHESGHAVMMAYLTGKLPIAIIGVDSERGGLTIVHDKERSEEINSKLDLENDVKIGLAGYYAELVVFGDQSRVLLGSGKDIEQAWEEFSEAVYSEGFFGPISYANYQCSTTGKIPPGFSDEEIGVRAKDVFDSWCEEVEDILEKNKTLIKNMTIELVKTGNMTGDRFFEIIGENKGTLDIERLDYARKKNSYDFYENVVNCGDGN